MTQIAPSNTSRNSKEKVFVQKELDTCTHVFIRNDTVRASLQPPYDGPFEVLKRNKKYFNVQLKNRKANISIDRLKAAFIDNPITNTSDFSSLTPSGSTSMDKKKTSDIRDIFIRLWMQFKIVAIMYLPV